MAIDPAFGMPYENFQQTGSFVQPVSVPVHGPFAGTLVQLGCVNVEWLRLLLGAATQLLNPSSWDPALSDAARVAVLQDATDLLGGLASLDACVNPVINVAIDCVNGLQYQTADMVWHVGTSMADICTCTNACLIPTVPANPGLTPTQQHACNIAGYLAQEVIRLSMTKMESYIGTSNEQVTFAKDVLQTIGFAFPITYAVANFLYDFYNDVVTQLLSQVTSTASDPVFWTDVTCAIYNCIRTVGYIDAANYPCIAPAIHAISYTYAWAPNAVGNFVGNMGLLALQSMQNIGSMDDVDCTGCVAHWCWRYNYGTSQGTSVSYTACATADHYVGGTGWVSGAHSGAPPVGLCVEDQLDPTNGFELISAIDMYVTASAALSTPGYRGVALYNGSTLVAFHDMGNNGIIGAPTWFRMTFTPVSINAVVFYMFADSGTTELIQVQIHGDSSSNPFGVDNCVF